MSSITPIIFFQKLLGANDWVKKHVVKRECEKILSNRGQKLFYLLNQQKSYNAKIY